MKRPWYSYPLCFLGLHLDRVVGHGTIPDRVLRTPGIRFKIYGATFIAYVCEWCGKKSGYRRGWPKFNWGRGRKKLKATR